MEINLLTEDGPEKKSFRTRAWIIVLHQELKDGRKYPLVEIDKREYKYLVIGDEVCPTTGRRHWQGYVEFKSVKSRDGVKKAFGRNDMYCAARKATPLQAATYCKKEGVFQEFGKISEQGHRSDLDTLCNEIVTESRQLHDMMRSTDAPLICKYRNGLRDIQAAMDNTHRNTVRRIKSKDYSCLREKLEDNLDCLRLENPDAFVIFQNAPTDIPIWNAYENETTIIAVIMNNNDWERGSNKLKTQLFQCCALDLDVKFGSKVAMWTEVHILHVNGTFNPKHDKVGMN